MNISHLIIFLVRAFAIVLAIYAINSLVFNLSIYENVNQTPKLSIAIPVILMVMGLAIWFLPYTIATLLSGYKGKNIHSTEEPSLENLSEIGFLILAFYLLFNVISDTAYWIYFYLNYQNPYGIPNEQGIDVFSKSSMVATFVEFIFVLILIFGSKKIIQLIKKLRS